MSRFGRALPLVLVGAGGFLGATLRYGVTLALPGTFPLDTLVANVVGSFLLGYLLFGARLYDLLTPELRLFAATGFCSSFTTYSTFAAETGVLPVALAALNVGSTYALGFAAVLAGRAVARRVGRWSA